MRSPISFSLAGRTTCSKIAHPTGPVAPARAGGSGADVGGNGNTDPVASNFDFVRPVWPALADDCVRAESYGCSDPRTAVFYARRVVEQLVELIYDLRALRTPYRDDLAARLGDSAFLRATEPEFIRKATLIRKAGNAAVHQPRPVSPALAQAVLQHLFDLVIWTFFRFSTSPDSTPLSATFDPVLMPDPAHAAQRSRDQLATLAAELDIRDAAVAEERAARQNLEAELDALRAQVAAAQAAKTVTVDTHDYTEAETRTDIIDLDLREAGWEPDDPGVREYPVIGMPASASPVSTGSTGGQGYVDYVLWGTDGLPLAVIEAKRTSKDASYGQHQAKLYADCLQAMTGRRPVIFSTNGFDIWLWDDAAGYPPRKVQGYYTRDELELLIQRRLTQLPLADRPINDAIAERHYQHRAIRRVGESFTTKRRRALLVMATGSGKTRTVIALIDQLMKAGWVKRVLFLADRVALVNQAVGAFRAHLPSATTVNLVTDKITDGRVYVSTYPTMMGLIDALDDDGRRVFGPGYFDLVVIDEAHRSVYAKYRAIFEWFDSLLVGLTATPKDEVDHNTYQLFQLEDGVPTDAYTLDEAVAEGFLVPPTSVAVPMKFLTRGVRYDELSEDEKDDWDAADWSEDGAVPDHIPPSEINKYLFNADTVDKVLEVLFTRGHRVSGGDRIGKTIVFARNAKHAEFVKERYDVNYPEQGGTGARVIVHGVSHVDSLIDDFSTAEKRPNVAISVDMLDTGIDVPEVCNLVFFKPVYSRTKFWQMIGRGTRLRPDLFGPGDDKADFRVFDFCGNLEYFSAPDAGIDGTLQKSLSQRLFETRLALVAGLDAAHSEPALRDDVAAGLRAIVTGMHPGNVLVRARRQWVEKWSAAQPWQRLSPDAAAEAATHLGDLPSTVTDDDEAAKRFDLLLLNLQLATLEGDRPTVDRLRPRVQAIAANLLGKTAIPAVAAELAILGEVESDGWWVDVTLAMLELARRRIRSLVRFVDVAQHKTVYSDFTDEVGEVVEVMLPGVTVGTNLERFRAKVRGWLAEHDDLVALQKLRRNRQLTPTDLHSIHTTLLAAGIGTPSDLERAVTESRGLGLFIRSLVGLDRVAAMDAFADYLHNASYTAAQIDFLDLIIEHLTANGTMEAARLYESPFTDRAPTGPNHLFSDPEIDGIVEILEDITTRATG